VTFTLRIVSQRQAWRTAGLGMIGGLCLASCGAADKTDNQNDALGGGSLGVDVVSVPAEGPSDSAANVRSSDVDITRQADRHVHGDASLALALDGGTLSAELESPLYNLVGFEHAPKTSAQTSAIQTAERLLSQPAALIQFNPEASCFADPVEGVKIMPLTQQDDGDSDHHDDHSHHNDHTEVHDEDHKSGEDHAHKDVRLNYQFICKKPDQLKWVDLALFETFPNLTEIDLVYLGPAQQMSTSLTSGSGRIQLVD